MEEIIISDSMFYFSEERIRHYKKAGSLNNQIEKMKIEIDRFIEQYDFDFRSAIEDLINSCMVVENYGFAFAYYAGVLDSKKAYKLLKQIHNTDHDFNLANKKRKHNH